MYAGIIKFMECILLAMAFVNALNETARDCDVYRMFSRGKGSARALRRRGLLMESSAHALRRSGIVCGVSYCGSTMERSGVGCSS